MHLQTNHASLDLKSTWLDSNFEPHRLQALHELLRTHLQPQITKLSIRSDLLPRSSDPQSSITSTEVFIIAVTTHPRHHRDHISFALCKSLIKQQFFVSYCLRLDSQFTSSLSPADHSSSTAPPQFRLRPLQSSSIDQIFFQTSLISSSYSSCLRSHNFDSAFNARASTIFALILFSAFNYA